MECFSLDVWDEGEQLDVLVLEGVVWSARSFYFYMHASQANVEDESDKPR